MKTIYCLFLFSLLCLPAAADETFRTWNDLFGRSFEAEIVSTSPGFVRLRNRIGKEVEYQIAHLTPADQTVALAWKSGPAPGAAKSAFVEGIEKDLVQVKGKKVEGMKTPELAQVKYFAFYKSASWCPPCRKFTPELVKFYNRIKPDHPEFELIFVSHDRSEDAMKGYMLEDSMPWPAFEFGKHKDAATSYGNGIPCLIVTDAEGNKLYDSYTKEKQYRGPASVMNELEKLLKKK